MHSYYRAISHPGRIYPKKEILGRKEMKIGVAYYPERCNFEQWKIDYQKIKEAGITTIRIAEFAWSKLEPVRGEFHWSWLDDSIRLAVEYGLDVILCTPTACPPNWLACGEPGILPLNEKGERMVFGKRQHRCYNTKEYLDCSRKIVEAMAKRYGKRQEIIGWQIDNELGGERQRCYCSNCEKEFQNFLYEKYGRIEELNDRWGNAFWSEEYQGFELIKAPHEIDGQLKLKHNPSLELEFWRFSSRSIVRFCEMQAEIIRKYSQVLVTTNTDSFAWGDCVNIYELFKKLDIGGMDLYSEDPREIAFYADLTRSLKNSGRFYMMEYGVASHTLDRELADLSLSGCEFVSLFKMNPFPWGQEQGYNGLLSMSGRPTTNYNMLKDKKNQNSCEWKETKEIGQLKIGIYYSFDSSWSFSIANWEEKQDRWIYAKYILEKVYGSIYETGARAGFLFDAEQINGYDTILVPRNVIYNEALEEALVRFVEDGGNLITTEDLFIKNIDNVYLTDTPACYISLFNKTDHIFLPEIDWKDESVLIKNTFGNGRVWVLKHSADAEDWKKAMEGLANTCNNIVLKDNL